MPQRSLAGHAGEARQPPSALTERLELILGWYKGMVSEATGRLVYSYDPELDAVITDGNPIRDIASIWDLELLSRFLGRSDLLPLAERSLKHHLGFLVARDGALIVHPDRLGEPAGIAHSAFMLLAILESRITGRAAKVVALAEGILRQQRPDGSYRIHFADDWDEGLEFYPGEAMLALMEAYALVHDPRYLSSVERGFGYYSDRFSPNGVAVDLLVFYANWQSQYAALLHAETRSDALRTAVRDYVFALHDRVRRSGFYDDIERYPLRQATVEIACALEGANDAYSIAARERDGHHMQSYEQSIQTALVWLFRAQRLEGCTPRERGGFGHSLIDRTQRIDVTGHVLAGFIKSARNHFDARR